MICNSEMRTLRDSNHLSVYTIVEANAKRFPNAIAIYAPGRAPLCYARLLEHLRASIESFNKFGIGRNDRLALVLPNGPEMATVFLGTTSCATAAPLNPAYSESEFEFYLSDIRAKALIVDSNTDSPARIVAEKINLPLIELSSKKESEAGIFNLHFKNQSPKVLSYGNAQSDDIALVLHTSGTTSRPKQVPLTHRNICNSAYKIQRTLRLTQADRCLNIMPLFHIHGLIGALLSSICSGAGVVCTPGFYVSKFFEWIVKYPSTWFTAVPTMLQSILSRAKSHDKIVCESQLRFIRSCSAALPPAVMQEIEGVFGVPVIESYGMTEASHEMASNPLPPGKRKSGSVGIATGSEIVIMDQWGSILSSGEKGEIAVRGPNVTSGYHNNPDANAASFTNGWFRTGDQGHLDSDGYLYITGRIKEIINRGGEKISPFEIDQILLKHPAIHQAVTFPISHPTLGEDVAATVVVKEGKTVSQLDLQGFVLKYLADFKVPRHIIFLNDIPKGPTGKIQRLKLASQLKLSKRKRLKINGPKPDIKTKSALLNTLMEIWKNVMGLPEIEPYDGFFQIGGDSIQAAQILARVNDTFRVDLSYLVFLNTPTVEGMARAIAAMQKTTGRNISSAMPPLDISTDIRNREKPFPLNDIQQAYWAGRSEGYELGGVSTHSYFEVDCNGADLQRLSYALNQLIGRHDMLRAVVTEDGFQQILSSSNEYRIKSDDLRSLSEDRRTQRLSSIRQRMSHQVVPSNRWPLFEIRASLMGHQRTRLHFSFDGLIMDAWSRNIFFKELTTLYRQPELVLTEFDLSFRDYVLADEAFKNSKRYQRSMQYWQDRFVNLPFPPELPIKKSGGDQLQTRFHRQTSIIPFDDWRQLKKRARKAGITPSGLLLAAFSVTVSVWSKTPRFLLNVPHFNRLQIHPQVNDIIGQFASLTFLECDTAKGDTFEDFAQQIQKQLWEDLEHGATGGVAVLRELSKYWNQIGQAVLPVVFTSAPQGYQEDVASTLQSLGNAVYSSSQTPQVWLDCQVNEESGSLVIDWNWIAAIFPEGVAENMFTAYTNFLTALGEDTNIWKKRLGEITQSLIPTEQIKQRKSINANMKQWPDDLLHDLISEQARLKPEHLAVIDSRQSLSYRELFNVSIQLAFKLLEWNLTPNRLIAIEMQPGWEQVAAVLGILFSGSAYLPIDPDQPAGRIQHILKDGGVDGILKQSWSNPRVSESESIRTIYVDKLLPECDSVSALDSRQTPSDTTCVIYTSGSTGSPKGIVINHRGVVNAIRFTNHRFPIGADDRILSLSPLFHDMSFYDLFGTLAASATIVFPDADFRKDPAHWVELMNRHNVTLWNSVPTMLQILIEYLIEHDRLLRPPIRLAFIGGEQVTPLLAERFTSLFGNARMVSVGGPTETTLWNIMHPIELSDFQKQRIPYGKPISNSRYYVLNESMEERPVWAIGELYCGGVGLAKGYWKDDDKTKSTFVQHPVSGERLYKTGDMGRYLPDGNIEILGRTDHQMKIRGYRIEAGEVEYALSKHPSIQTSVVKAVKDSAGDNQLVAYVVKESSNAFNSSDLQAFLSQHLPPQMVPSAFIVMPRIPLLPNGKVDHQSLPPPNFQSKESIAEPVPKNDTLIARMTEIVSNVLKIAKIESEVNWFSLGATSIDIIRILNRLEQELNFRPRIDQVYEEPSISGLVSTYNQSRTIYQEIEPACEPIPEAYTSKAIMIKDPEAREEFRGSQPGIRPIQSGYKSVQLNELPDQKTLMAKYSKRRSYRNFNKDPISFDRFSRFIECLRQIKINGHVKYLYPSAGGLYSIQTYLYVKHGRVQGVSQGSYYYHPIDHALCLLTVNAQLDRTIYGRSYNRAIFDESAFAIFLVVNLDAIFPMYGPNSVHLATLDSGYMSQLLSTTAIEYQIGLCPIGSLNFAPVRHLFSLKEGQILLHSLLGGGISLKDMGGMSLGCSDRSKGIEEGEI